MTNFLPS